MHRTPQIYRTCSIVPMVVALIAAPTVPLDAENWPQFRGPTGQGHASTRGLPVQWDLATHATWKKTIPGKGWSSPVLDDGLIFVTTAVAEGDDPQADQSLRALCFDAAQGELLWDVEVFYMEASERTKIHKKNSHASATPIVDEQHLYVHFATHGTAAIDFTGQIAWKKKPFDYDPRHGTGSSPILSGDLLIVNCDGYDRAFVAALDRHTGEIVWETPRPPAEEYRFSFSTPLEIEVAGRRQVVSPGSHGVCSYDRETGQEIWRVRYPEKWSIVPRPVFSHGLVFVCTGFEGPASLLAIRPDGTGDVTESHVAWKADRNIPYKPSPIVVGETIFLVSDMGVASAREVQTGQLLWRKRLGGNYSASPIHAEGKLYFVSEAGQCVVIEATDQYREIARSDMQEPALASFAVADKALFVRTAKHLYRIETPPRKAAIQAD